MFFSLQNNHFEICVDTLEDNHDEASDVQEGNLRNGDHLLQVGNVRLWGMGAQQVVNSVNIIAISHQHHHHHHYSDHHHHVDHLHHQHDHHLQVAAILRSAGQECIRLVVARPIDPADIHQPVFVIIIIIITRPMPAYGRQGLAVSWGQNTDEVSTFLVFLTSHFAPAALSSDLNQPGIIDHDKNPPGIMKTRPGAIKKHEKPPGTMKNRPVTKKPTGNFKSQPGTMIYPQIPSGKTQKPRKMENQPKPLKTYKNRHRTMKNQSGTIKTNLELDRVVMRGSGGYKRLPGGSDDFSLQTNTAS